MLPLILSFTPLMPACQLICLNRINATIPNRPLTRMRASSEPSSSNGVRTTSKIELVMRLTVFMLGASGA